MKSTLRLLLAGFVLSACADSTSPPHLAETGDQTLDAARSVATDVTILRTFGGTSAQASAINDAGTVVGYASETNSTRTTFGVTYAARWVRDANGAWGAPTRLGAVGGRALAVNERGDAVGMQGGSAQLWPAAGGATKLIGGVIAQGINNAGIVVGGTQEGNRGTAVVWIPDANSSSGYTARGLSPLEGGSFALAFAINETGVIAGAAVSAAGRDQAVVWSRTTDGGWSPPVPLSGADSPLASSVAYGINARGDVVGAYSPCLGCGFRASYWPVTGGRVDFSAFYANENASHAYGIADDPHRVVGRFYSRNTSPNPFLWAPGNTALIDLGTGQASDINNLTPSGQHAVGFKPGSKGGSQATVWRIQ